MTLEEESRLSFYRELTAVDDKKNIFLVQNADDMQIYVKKTLDAYLLPIYTQLASFNVDGVPEIIECVRDKDRLVIIEEYIAGQNLSQMIKRYGLLKEDEAYRIFKEITLILTKLHMMNPPVIHRDIKPSNIIIDKNGHAHLIDFNAARNVNGDKDEDTRMLGTMYFAAPEQYGFGQSDSRTDIYGIAATINYCMTGDKPGAGVADGKLHKILEKCLKIDAKDRYESADVLYNELSALEMNTDRHENNEKRAGEYSYDKSVEFASDEEKKIENSSSWRRFLLPGFRSGNILHIILASFWYVIIIATVTAGELTRQDGTVIEGMELAIDRFFIFIIIAGSTLWYGNYLNVQKKFPGMNNNTGIARVILLVVYGFLYITIVCAVMMLMFYILGIDM